MSQWEPRAALNSDGQYRNMRRNREVRLEGFEPPTPGLGKRDDTLQWIAEVCESCIPKPFFLPRIAGDCRAVHSRWCQSGVRGISLTALTCTLLLGFLAVTVVLVPPLHRGRAQDVPNEEREALARNRGRRPDPGRRREARLVAQGGGIARRVSAPGSGPRLVDG
jgi:hypothetical protein